MNKLKRCPNCGEPLQVTDKICTNCGAFLDVVAEEPQESEEPVKFWKAPENEEEQDSLSSSPKKKKKKNNNNMYFNNDLEQYEALMSSSSNKQKKTRYLYWPEPLLSLAIAGILYLTSVFAKNLITKELSIFLYNAAIVFGVATVPIVIIVIVLYLLGKTPKKIMTPEEIINSNSIPAEQRRMAYVGANYVVISREGFSLPACLFNFSYLIYRKQYLIGLFLILVVIVLFLAANFIPFLKIAAIIVIVICAIISGMKFNSWYINKATKKTQKLKDDNSNLDLESFLALCQKKGGTNIYSAVLITVLFIISLLLLSFVDISVKADEPKTKEEEDKVSAMVTNGNRKKQCKDYAAAVNKSYHEAQYDVTYIGCNMGSNYILMTAKKFNSEREFIVKYEIKEKNNSLVRIGTTEDMSALEQKELDQTITEKEKKDLEYKRELEAELPTFKNYVVADKERIKNDDSYVRDYIEININNLD